MLKITSIDYSAVSQFCRCPLKWALEHVAGLSSSISEDIYLGSAVHKAMENYHRYKDNIPPVWLSEADLIAEFDRVWDSGEPAIDRQGNRRSVIWKNGEYAMRAMGQEMLRTYYPWVNKVSPLLVEQRIEKTIEVDGESITVYGTIDLVTSQGIPIDLKTASRLPSQPDIAAGLQPTFYCYLLGGPSKFVYHYLIKSKQPTFQQVSTERKAEDIHWLQLALPKYIRAMQSGNYFPNRSNLCAYCSYVDACLSGNAMLMV